MNILLFVFIAFIFLHYAKISFWNIHPQSVLIFFGYEMGVNVLPLLLTKPRSVMHQKFKYMQIAKDFAECHYMVNNIAIMHH